MTTAHFGPYSGLAAAHAALRAWCDGQGHRSTGISWELYGHWEESWNTDPSKIRTDVRPERSEDIAAISRVTEEAFRGHPHSSHTEQFIVAELRRCGASSLSLVAEWDSAVVGHIAFSPVEISDGSPGWYGLGPVSVAPDFQRRGIGQALVSAGLAALRSSGAEGCVVLGEPEFYVRFGFRNHPDCVLEGVPAEYFQVLSFGGRLASGTVSYHPAFSAGS